MWKEIPQWDRTGGAYPRADVTDEISYTFAGHHGFIRGAPNTSDMIWVYPAERTEKFVHTSISMVMLILLQLLIVEIGIRIINYPVNVLDGYADASQIAGVVCVAILICRGSMVGTDRFRKHNHGL